MAKWSGQVISWAATLIIARVLTPEDYGVIAAAIVVSGFLDLGTGLGLGPALVQSEDIDDETVSRAAGVTLLGGVLGAVLMALVAPGWALLQGDKRLTAVLWVLCVAVILTAVQSVPAALLSRKLRFKSLALGQLIQGIVTAAVSLVLTFTLRSYWALILGLLVGKMVYTGIVLVLEPVRPRVPTLKGKMRGLARFGALITGDRFLWYFRQNFDIVIIGAVLGQTMLGFFSIALTLARVPLDKITSVLAPVVFPVLSRTQSDPEELRRRHLGVSAGVSVIAFPAAAGLTFLAGDLIPILVGEKWIPAVFTMRILAAISPLVMLWSLNAPALHAVGRVGLTFRFSVLMTLVAPVAMWVGTRWGIEGVALAGGLALLAVSLYAFPTTWMVLGISPGAFLRGLCVPTVSTVWMVAALAGARHLMTDWDHVPIVIVLVPLGVVTYVGWLFLVHPTEARQMLSALKAAWRGEGKGVLP